MHKRAHLNSLPDELWVALEALEHSEEDDSHDGGPDQLVCCSLGENCLIRTRVVWEHVLVQNLVPPAGRGQLRKACTCRQHSFGAGRMPSKEQ